MMIAYKGKVITSIPDEIKVNDWVYWTGCPSGHKIWFVREIKNKNAIVSPTEYSPRAQYPQLSELKILKVEYQDITLKQDVKKLTIANLDIKDWVLVSKSKVIDQPQELSFYVTNGIAHLHPLTEKDLIIRKNKTPSETQAVINSVLLVELYLKSFGFSISAIESVIENYSQPWRKYHTLQHINHLLNKFRTSDHWKDLAPLERQALNIAIIFHDVVYEVGSKTNEINSAEFLRYCNSIWSDETLEPKVFPTEYINGICEIILSTKDHIPTSKLSKILIELDLSSFDLSWKECLEQNYLVMEEFGSKFTWEEFQKVQINFLESYKHKVNTPQAQENIQDLINLMKVRTSF